MTRKGERLSRWVPPSVTDGRSWRIRRSRRGQEELLPARGRWCFHGSASLPSFVFSLDLELGTKERRGSGRPSPCEQLREPGEAAWQITTGKRIELEFLLQGTAGCCSHGMGADPALLRAFSSSARWHQGCRLLFSLLSKALSQCSALSCLSGCPWRASWDTRSCWAGPWQVAGGRQPLSHCHRQRARAVGQQLGLPGALGMLFLPPFFFPTVFYPPCCQRSFFLWNSQPASSCCRASPSRRRGKQKAPGMPSSNLVTQQCCH